jgi:hypothetical protein
MHANVTHLPGVWVPYAMLVQVSTPTWGKSPAFLFPPPEFSFTNDAAYLALFDPFNKTILFIYT